MVYTNEIFLLPKPIFYVMMEKDSGVNASPLSKHKGICLHILLQNLNTSI